MAENKATTLDAIDRQVNFANSTYRLFRRIALLLAVCALVIGTLFGGINTTMKFGRSLFSSFGMQVVSVKLMQMLKAILIILSAVYAASGFWFSFQRDIARKLMNDESQEDMAWDVAEKHESQLRLLSRHSVIHKVVGIFLFLIAIVFSAI